MRATVRQYLTTPNGQATQLRVDDFDRMGIRLASALHGRELTEEQIDSTIQLFDVADGLGIDIWK